jgi:MOSC domain-containing protein YiiM
VSSHGRIVQISTSRGGVPKLPVEAARVTELGVAGDAHRDTEHHGGPERALCLFAMERIRALQAEGHPIGPGSIGENVTVEGLDWSAVAPGTRLLLGEAVLVEVTRYTSPCANITGAFKDGDYSRVSQKRHAGDSRVYARVLRPGAIRRGDPVRLLAGDEAASLLAPLPSPSPALGKRRGEAS